MGTTEQSILIILVISTAAFYTIQAEDDDHGHKPDLSHDQDGNNKANETNNAVKAQAPSSDELVPGPDGPAPSPEGSANSPTPYPADEPESAIEADASSQDESSEENEPADEFENAIEAGASSQEEPDPADPASIPYVHSTLYLGQESRTCKF